MSVRVPNDSNWKSNNSDNNKILIITVIMIMVKVIIDVIF